MIELIETYKYFILFPLAFVEGPFVMMISGLLVRLGYLNFFAAYALLMTGDWCADMGWYGLGYKFGMPFVKKFGKYFDITEHNIEKVKKIFTKYDSMIIFVSKITMGMGFALVTLVTAGLVKIPFKRFTFWNGLGGLIWTGFLMTIGFSLGNFYLQMNSVLGKISILALLVVIFIILTSLAKHARRKVLASHSL
jgi:membrane protein DedA with SNARE-associated domain